jgi:hypothetical protein
MLRRYDMKAWVIKNKENGFYSSRNYYDKKCKLNNAQLYPTKIEAKNDCGEGEVPVHVEIRRYNDN